jgi:hypothetical protein
MLNLLNQFVAKWNREDEDTYHFRISVVKSGLRIAAGLFLLVGATFLAGVGLVVAELFGIVEEL